MAVELDWAKIPRILDTRLQQVDRNSMHSRNHTTVTI